MVTAGREFEMIRRYFQQPARYDRSVVLGIGDDCALLAATPDSLQAISVDTSIAGVHFPADADPFDIAYRALNVSLSDLAAMGAEARWFTLALTLPAINDDWLAGFSRGLFQAADNARVQLIGGDTTRGPLSITIQVQGEVPPGRALLRSGARIGDYIYVSGFLGDAGGGLAASLGQLPATAATAALLQAYLRPEPRLALGIVLRGIATSCIDISDGLLADLGHILECSRAGAEVDLDRLPLSPALLATFNRNKALELALTAGDDYQLCFTSPLGADALPVNGMHCIGRIVAGNDLRLSNRPADCQLETTGFDHFHD